jgi:hypothetical protein
VRTRECTACGVGIGPELYGECTRCSSVTLCEPCASRHWCNGENCRNYGCVPGQCIRLVEHGVIPPRRLGPEGARARWGEARG